MKAESVSALDSMLSCSGGRETLRGPDRTLRKQRQKADLNIGSPSSTHIEPIRSLAAAEVEAVGVAAHAVALRERGAATIRANDLRRETGKSEVLRTGSCRLTGATGVGTRRSPPLVFVIAVGEAVFVTRYGIVSPMMPVPGVAGSGHGTPWVAGKVN